MSTALVPCAAQLTDLHVFGERLLCLLLVAEREQGAIAHGLHSDRRHSGGGGGRSSWCADAALDDYVGEGVAQDLCVGCARDAGGTGASHWQVARRKCTVVP